MVTVVLRRARAGEAGCRRRRRGAAAAARGPRGAGGGRACPRPGYAAPVGGGKRV